MRRRSCARRTPGIFGRLISERAKVDLPAWSRLTNPAVLYIRIKLDIAAGSGVEMAATDDENEYYTYAIAF